MVLIFENAPSLYKALNGVFCIYKPAGHSLKQIAYGIQTRLADELNQLPCRPPKPRLIYHEENLDTDLPVVSTVPDLADHPLVVGPRYIREDFRLHWCSHLKKRSSGVVALGIGRAGSYFIRQLSRSHQLRVYHVKGELGTATQDFHPDGRIVEKTTYYHVKHDKVDKVVAAMQAGHQQYMFAAANVNPQSQEAYELACRGMLRPKARESGAVIYGMKCIEFNPPNFTLEVHAVNENCDDLSLLTHQLGLQLKSSAVCTQMRRIRYGEFNLVHALLKKHWSAQHIAENIVFCRPLVEGIEQLSDCSLSELPDRQLEYLDSGKERYLDQIEEESGQNFLPT